MGRCGHLDHWRGSIDLGLTYGELVDHPKFTADYCFARMSEVVHNSGGTNMGSNESLNDVRAVMEIIGTLRDVSTCASGLRLSISCVSPVSE